MEGRSTLEPSNEKAKSSIELNHELEAAMALVASIQKAQKHQKDQEEFLASQQGAQVLAPNSPSPRKKRPSEDGRPSSRAFGGPSGFNKEMARREETVFDAPVDKKPKIEEPSHAHLLVTRRPSNLKDGFDQVAQDRKNKAAALIKANNRSLGFNGVRPPPVDTSRASLPAMSSKKEKQNSGRIVPQSSSAFALSLPLQTGLPKSESSSRASTSRQRIEEVKEEDDDDEDELDILDGPVGPNKRNKDGTIRVELVQGPIEHKRIAGDPNFETIEPNSGIRLRRKSRQISHDDLQSHLSDRYHLTPALMYTLLKPGPTPNSQDVDVVGDYIVIGVLAWKDEVRFVNGGALKEEIKEEKVVKRWEGVKGVHSYGNKGKGKEEEEGEEEEVDETFRKETKRVKQKRYLRFTLVDLSTEAAGAAGHGTLSVMLFEADSENTITDGDGNEFPTYKGGSGGAYEKFWKESTGAIVAIMNPGILKSRPTPGFPNVLTITPNSADSMMVIGRAKDLGSCEALNRKTGGACGNWVDTRVHTVCEYHLTAGVKQTAGSRAETNSTNSSMAKTITFDPVKFRQGLKAGSRSSGSQAPCDRVNKIGLLPRNNVSMVDGAQVYVTAGSGTMFKGGPSQSRSNSSNSRSASASLGAAALQSGNGSGGYIQGWRDGPTVKDSKREVKERSLAKALRKQELAELVNADKGRTIGGQYMLMAEKARKEKERVGKGGEGDKVIEERERKERRKQRERKGGEEDDEDEEMEEDEVKKRKPFGNAAVRLIGYDPTHTADSERDEDEDTRRRRLAAVSSLSNHTSRAPAKLGAPPGAKVRSGVSVPKAVISVERKEADLPDMRKGTSREEESEISDDDLVVEGGPGGE